MAVQPQILEVHVLIVSDPFYNLLPFLVVQRCSTFKLSGSLR